MDNQKKLVIEPNQSTGREILGKILIGIIIGGIIAVLLFFILTAIGKLFFDSMTQVGDYTGSNPILPLLIILIAFIVSFIGNIGFSSIYHIFFSKKHHNIRQSIGVIALSNGILLLFLIPLYFIFNRDTNTMFIIMGFHIILGCFLSSLELEVISNPNYGISSIIGNTCGLAMVILAYGIIWKLGMQSGNQDKVYLLFIFPPVIAYGIMPLGQGIREIIYHKIFEIGNNPFFTQSKEEDIIQINSSEEEKKGETPISIPNENDDINIDIN